MISVLCYIALTKWVGSFSLWLLVLPVILDIAIIGRVAKEKE